MSKALPPIVIFAVVRPDDGVGIFLIGVLSMLADSAELIGFGGWN